MKYNYFKVDYCKSVTIYCESVIMPYLFCCSFVTLMFEVSNSYIHRFSVKSIECYCGGNVILSCH